MLGQLQPAGAQQLGAVDHRVHQQILGGSEAADVRPGKDPVFREHIGIAHDLLGVVLHMLIYIVAHHEVHRIGLPGKFPQFIQHLFQRIGIQPVVRVHHFVIEPGGVAQALIHALAVAAVGLVDGSDNAGILLGIPVADGRGVVLGGAVVHQDDLNVIPSGQKGLHTVIHIGRGIVAGYRKGNELVHGAQAPFSASVSHSSRARATMASML